MEEYLIRLSKTISHALRHQPEAYGLELDPEGWVAVDDLLSALRERRNAWHNVSEAEIHQIITGSEKQRFEISNGEIRAYYGHSTREKVTKQPATPPALLYHGTTPQAYSAIMNEGLKPMRRHYVHLSTEEQTARKVALRRTRQPVILHVDAHKAHEQGIRFYPGNEDIWLADVIPPEYLQQV
jgi:putative RNA 2'-phosphotransferase